MSDQVTVDGGRSEEELSLDLILELLSQYQRREIIRYLHDSPGQDHALDELIAHLADLECKRDGEVPGSDHLLSVLVHIHGPKLQEAGMITYDVEDGVVRYHPDERVEQILEEIESFEANR